MSCFPGVWAPTALSYFTSVVSVVLMLLIVFGNITIILAVVIDPMKRLRTPFNYFLVNLAVSDILVGSVTMPVSIAIHLQEANGWIDSHLIKVIHLSYFMSATASVFSLSALSVDRYCAIRWPIRYRRQLNMRRCALLSLLIWFVSILVPLLYLKTGYIDYLMVFIHTAVLVTFGTLILTYVQVYRAFRRQIQQIRSFRHASDADRFYQLNTVRSEKKVTRTFLWILGFFVSTYTPAIIMIYILQFCTQCSCVSRHTLRDLQFLLVSANSAVNPFICVTRLKAFRDCVLLLLKLKTKTRNGSSYIVRSHQASKSSVSKDTTM